jgi:hypothetical protein
MERADRRHVAHRLGRSQRRRGDDAETLEAVRTRGNKQ